MNADLSRMHAIQNLLQNVALNLLLQPLDGLLNAVLGCLQDDKPCELRDTEGQPHMGLLQAAGGHLQRCSTVSCRLQISSKQGGGPTTCRQLTGSKCMGQQYAYTRSARR